MFENKNYIKSLEEIKEVVQFMDSCHFDETNDKYSNAFNHVARSTYAYIALSMNLDYEKVNY